jgi:ATP-binding cassette subfamily B protein
MYLEIDLMKKSNILNNIIFLWKYLGKNRKFQFIFLIFLMLLSVFAEIISIGSIIPFLSALTEPEKLMKIDWIQPILISLEIDSNQELLLFLTLGFISASIFAGILRILLLWMNTRISASMGIQLRSELYAKTLYQSYEFHISHNSSQLISMVTEKAAFAIFAGIMHVLMMISALSISIAIIGTLIYINPIVALLTFTVLGGAYILVGIYVRKKVKENGDIIAKNQPDAVKCMQEGLGGIRDIIMDNSQKIFIDLYTKVATNIQLAGMRNSLLAGIPKPILETLSIILIASLAYYLQLHSEDKEQVLPILGALALGAQRLLPSLQQIYYSWSTINNYQTILDEVVTQLQYKNKDITPLKKKESSLAFHKSITLENIKFKYKDTNSYVLNNINLNIKKGSTIGFIGTTGSGKSTLIDIIMGLLKPTDGYLKIDNIKVNSENITHWQSNIAHVPQTIFLTDTSIAENIAFGVTKNKINLEKVKQAAQKANLHNFIENLPEKYNTSVGERGVQLSGGQRQRIGIARALYKEAEVIIFDEATSALDNKTEETIMREINNLDTNLTILIIAHRLTTLKKCDLIYKLSQGSIETFGTYKEMIHE